MRVGEMNIKDKIILFFMLHGCLPDCTIRGIDDWFLDKGIDGYNVKIKHDKSRQRVKIEVIINDPKTIAQNKQR